MTTALLACEYFPSIAWYQQFNKAAQVCLEQYEFFERRSFRNRCHLAGPNEMVTLSVPLLGGRNQKTIMKDIKISYEEDWRPKHWKTIVSAYKNSPYFDFFEAQIFSFFQQKPTFLLDLNLQSLQLIQSILQKNTSYSMSTSYVLSPSDDIKDFRQSFSTQSKVHHENLPQYWQTFQERHGFLPNLSMLDILFCCGQETLSLI